MEISYLETLKKKKKNRADHDKWREVIEKERIENLMYHGSLEVECKKEEEIGDDLLLLLGDGYGD